jgi:hypothetical protein
LGGFITIINTSQKMPCGGILSQGTLDRQRLAGLAAAKNRFPVFLCGRQLNGADDKDKDWVRTLERNRVGRF